MAFYRAKRKGGGGSVQKTTLWSNPNPTADFGPQTVSLSDDMNNYDYLEFTFRIVKTGTNDHIMLAPVSDFKQTSYSSGLGNFKYGFSASTAAYILVCRYVYYKSDTQVDFSQNVVYRTSGNVNTPSQAIPIYIKGVKI